MIRSLSVLLILATSAVARPALRYSLSQLPGPVWRIELEGKEIPWGPGRSRLRLDWSWKAQQSDHFTLVSKNVASPLFEEEGGLSALQLAATTLASRNGSKPTR